MYLFCFFAGGKMNRKYPVLVLVHGESYEWNSGNPYDGTVLASYGGLLVVTINYRLGVLGTLFYRFSNFCTISITINLFYKDVRIVQIKYILIGKQKIQFR